MSRTSRVFLVLFLALAACSAGEGGSRVGGARDGGGAALDGAGADPDGGAKPGDDGGAVDDGGTPGAMDSGNGGADGGPTGADASRDGGGATDGGPRGCGEREACGNGLDDNCNGTVDETCPCLPGATQRCYDGPPAQAGVGVCTLGTQTCTGAGEFGSWGACMGAGRPQPVQCGRMMDFRCTGVIDEGCACTPGATRACYSGPTGTAGRGLCRAGTQTCTMTSTGATWGTCVGQVTPRPELCDGTDRDCDGTVNNGCTCSLGTSRSCYTGPAGTAGVGTCRQGTQNCVAASTGTGTMWGPCQGQVLPQMNLCDGIDRACTGDPSAGCACTLGRTRGCYTGPASTRMVGICRDGEQRCESTGGTINWSSTCAGEVRPQAAEVCGNGADDNCNGMVDEGCGGSLTCPRDQTVPAGTAVSLTATGVGVTGYSWTIVTAPMGGAGTARWSPNPPNAMTEQFTPFIVGTYGIRVSGTDAGGRTVSCMFNVTALPHGLRVQLTWNGTGDVDLHVHNGNMTRWFAVDDAYYANRTPAWGASLDFDNVTANGPENTVIDNPVIGMPYTVAVHNYAAAAGRVATVQIFCGSSGTVATATYNSRALAGSDRGDCTNNDFWRVARVVFTSPSACTVTPINTYSPSRNACMSF